MQTRDDDLRAILTEIHDLVTGGNDHPVRIRTLARRGLQMLDSIALTGRERTLLVMLAQYDMRFYIKRPKSLKRLTSLALVEYDRAVDVWHITAQGKAYLARMSEARSASDDESQVPRETSAVDLKKVKTDR